VAAVDPLTVFVHPTCSKSRAVTEILNDRGAAFITVNYLESPPGADTLGTLLDRLDGAPADLVRVDDDRFVGLGLSAGDVADRAGVIAVLVAHPELMQRPVVVRGHRAVVARPPEVLDELFSDDAN
jgi:arsenate reductase (glutaredoxin)